MEAVAVSDFGMLVLGLAVVLTPVVAKVLAIIWPSKLETMLDKQTQIMGEQAKILAGIEKHLELEAVRHEQHFDSQEKLTASVGILKERTAELLHLVRS